MKRFTFTIIKPDSIKASNQDAILRRISNSGISEDSTLVKSPAKIECLKFASRALIADCFISDVNTHSTGMPNSIAACSNPILIPPNPANRSINFILFLFFICYAELVVSV